MYIIGSETRLVLFGIESHFAPDVIDAIQKIGASVSSHIITAEPQWDLTGVTPLHIEQVTEKLLEEPFFVVRNNPSGLRQSLYKKAIETGFSRSLTLLHPSAVIAATARIEQAVFVGAQAVLAGSCTVSYGTYINRLAGVGHHTVLDQFVTIGPGANVCSKVRIGKGTTIGAGASIAPGLTIGSNSVIAAGAAVHKDIPSNVVVLGNPSRIVKQNIVGHMDVGVE